MKCQRVKIGNSVGFVCGARERTKTLKFPVRRKELVAAGYRDSCTRGSCRSCGASFEWWWTPNENWMPVSNLPNGLLQPHHIDCPDAQRYRDASRGYKARTETPKPKQGSLF